jgi:high-affinity nickel permease
MILAADSLTDKGSIINQPYTYTHTQKVGGLIYTITVTVILVSIALLIAYRNFGPPARRAATSKS